MDVDGRGGGGTLAIAIQKRRRGDLLLVGKKKKEEEDPHFYVRNNSCSSIFHDKVKESSERNGIALVLDPPRFVQRKRTTENVY